MQKIRLVAFKLARVAGRSRARWNEIGRGNRVDAVDGLGSGFGDGTGTAVAAVDRRCSHALYIAAVAVMFDAEFLGGEEVDVVVW